MAIGQAKPQTGQMGITSTTQTNPNAYKSGDNYGYWLKQQKARQATEDQALKQKQMARDQDLMNRARLGKLSEKELNTMSSTDQSKIWGSMTPAQRQYAESIGRAPRDQGNWKTLQTNLREQVQSFEKNMPKRSQMLGGLLAEEARRQYAPQEQALRRQASSRGLLYSGLRAGADASLQGNVASEALKQRLGARQQVQGELDQLRRGAMGAQLSRDQSLQDQMAAGSQMASQRQAFQNQMDQQNTQNMIGVGGALGSAFGTWRARQDTKDYQKALLGK